MPGRDDLPVRNSAGIGGGVGENEDNTNNASIQACNEEIRQIAEENGAVYVDAFSALAGPDGCLPADAAADGVHPSKEYTEKWVQVLQESMKETAEA